jgi:hypothetical protein
MLPPEEQKAMNTAYVNFDDAWFQFRMKLNDSYIRHGKVTRNFRSSSRHC